MTALEFVHNFIDIYNAEDSYLSFFIPLTLWLSAFLYCEFKAIKFAEYVPIFNTHHALGLAFATISLYFDDESIFPERNVIMFTLSFFTVDLIDSLRNGDIQYTIHAICCLFLGLSNYNTPTFYRLRMNSKAMYHEISSPFLHWSKKTRKPLHFAMFALAFTLCRIVWLPIMIKQILDDGFPWKDFRFLVIVAFYTLNLYWYSKIVKILIYGPSKKKNKKE